MLDAQREGVILERALLGRKLPDLDELRRSSSKLQHRALGGLVHRVSRLRLSRAELGDLSIPYLESGEGTPLLFLHGFADQKETWALLAPRLADRHRVLVPDLPGFGDATPVPPERATLPQQSRHLAKFLDKLGIQEPVHLCGNSMGGGLAVQFAADFPERVASLILISPMGPTVTRSELQEELERDDSHCSLLCRTPDDYYKTLDFVFARKPPLPRIFWRHLANRAAERYQLYHDIFFHLADRMVGWSDTIPPLACPVLLIHGRRDRVIHWNTSRAWAQRFPQGRLLVLDDVGHAPQWEAPRRTLSAMRSFLSQV